MTAAIAVVRTRARTPARRLASPPLPVSRSGQPRHYLHHRATRGPPPPLLAGVVGAGGFVHGLAWVASGLASRQAPLRPLARTPASPCTRLGTWGL